MQNSGKRCQINQQTEIKPRRRLNKKIGAEEVAELNNKWLSTQKVNRQGIARAEPYRNTEEKEDTETFATNNAEGKVDDEHKDAVFVTS